MTQCSSGAFGNQPSSPCGGARICSINGAPIYCQGGTWYYCGTGPNAYGCGISTPPTPAAPAAPAAAAPRQCVAPAAPPCQGFPVNEATSQAIESKMQSNALNPQLACNMKYTYTPINPCAPGTLLNYCKPCAPTHVNAQTVNAQTTCKPKCISAATYQATPTQAYQGTVNPCSMVQQQFCNINNNSKMVCEAGTQVPQWAQTAVTAARQQMAALGLGASTVAGNATAGAVLNTELPMAEQNAQTVANVNLQNIQNRQAALTSTAAAQNAAAQFNASSQNQVSEFMTNLDANIAMANTATVNAVNEFNAGQENTVNQFNAQLQNQYNEFNAQNQLLVNQSNVQWQRAVNTANTAEQNATNNANAQNTFNMSQTALQNEWQMIADQASWNVSIGQNQANRNMTLAVSAMNQQTAISLLNSQLQAQMFSQLGSFATSLLGGASGISSGISKLLGGGSGSIGCSFNTAAANCITSNIGSFCTSTSSLGCFCLA